MQVGTALSEAGYPADAVAAILGGNFRRLHVILAEEWEHHRYAVRDLDAIDATSDA
jgi:hypothetical protein